jgi:hypothetical protein
LAFLAGFSSNELIMKANAVAKAIFRIDSPMGEDAGGGKPKRGAQAGAGGR